MAFITNWNVDDGTFYLIPTIYLTNGHLAYYPLGIGFRWFKTMFEVHVQF